MKQIVFLFALLLLPLTASADAVEIDGIYYILDTTKHAQVTENPDKYSGNISIPETVFFDGVTYTVFSIDDGAFNSCTNLLSVTIPNSVTSIGMCAFEQCEGLTSITIPNSVTTIGAVAFAECISLTSVIIPNSITSIEGETFANCENLGSVTIPNSVTYIGSRAFQGCSFISISIPNSVTYIDSQAFYSCEKLTSVDIPSSVSYIHGSAFSGCDELASIHVDTNNSTYDSRDNCNAIVSTKYNALVLGCKNTIIPNTVTSIGNNAFFSCDGLTSIEIPNSVQTICAGAFAWCSKLTSVNIPNSVTTIESEAFYWCGFTSITIPESVTSIGGSAFSSCFHLKEVRSLIEEPFEISESVFSNWDYSSIENLSLKFTSATLYVPAGTKAKYEATDGWKEFANIVEMEAQDLEPVDGGEDISFGGADSEIDEETDLDGNVVGNVLYNIQPDNGQYNPVEGCIEVTKPMTDEEMEDLEGKDVFGEDVHDNYTGIVFKVPAGSGTITVEADALGAMTLKVKIGKQEPIELIPVGKMKMKIPYTVDKPTYIYIYAGMMDSDAARGQNRAAATPKLKLYGIATESTSGITETMAASPTESVYAIGGQRLATRQRGLNIVRMSDGTVRKIVAK